MDRTLALLTFISLCSLCIAFMLVLGITVFALRKGATIPTRMKAFYLLASLGVALSTLVAYYQAFGRHTDRLSPLDVVRVGVLGVYGTAFWIARKPLRQVLSRFVQANGGTAGSALANALRHPGQSYNRLGSLRQGVDTEPPPV